MNWLASLRDAALLPLAALLLAGCGDSSGLVRPGAANTLAIAVLVTPETARAGTSVNVGLEAANQDRRAVSFGPVGLEIRHPASETRVYRSDAVGGATHVPAGESVFRTIASLRISRDYPVGTYKVTVHVPRRDPLEAEFEIVR